MLVASFFGKNGGRAASGVAAEKKIYFFSPFVSRTHVSRGKWSAYIPIHAARDKMSVRNS
jgi:hypothetical protein